MPNDKLTFGALLYGGVLFIAVDGVRRIIRKYGLCCGFRMCADIG